MSDHQHDAAAAAAGSSHGNTNNPQQGAGRPLPKREADLFRSVVRQYESKQYKKAMKTADLVLKRFPNHGETLAMKGLIINAINYHAKRDEAHELVKRALTMDMRSHVCWHVYGLLHRTDRNYGEAIKAYKQALRLDPNNQQILRDLSMLQVQMRDLDGFCRTRNALLTLRPNAKANWMAFALSKHLVGEHREAVRVIDTYLGTLSDEHSSDELGRSFESSELALYKNRILAEIPGTPGGGKNYREALEHLTACEGIVVDRTSWLLTKATYQLALQDFGGAQNTVRELFDRGMTEHYAVHTLYVSSVLEVQDWDLVREAMRLKGTRTILALLPLPDEDRARIRDTYESDLSKRYPDSYAVRTIPVTLLALSLIANATTSEATTTATGSEATAASELRNVLVQMCRKGLTKGVPSLCSELSSFVWVEKNGRYVRPDDPVDYASHPVFQLIVEVADELAACLQSESKIASSAEGEEPPSTVMWAWYLQAGLCELSGEHKKGLDLLDRCLEHTPTECEVYALKVRLLQASGGAAQAAECLDKARELDTQDRYMNNLATQYMLRAGMEDRALRTISLFAKHEGNPEQNLFDMQCSWYELEVAAHLARKQDWGRSLKKYAAVVKHFEDIIEDQFDFHGYCLRKVTLRAYVDLLRFEDEAYGQDYFCEAAAGMVRIYLHLMDHPMSENDAEPDYSSMTAAERKKAKAIARKKKKAAEKKEEAAVAASADAAHGNTNGTSNHNSPSNKPKGGAAGGAGKPSFVEQDPLGKELLGKDPTDEARKYSALLAQHAPSRLQSWLLSYDVSIRRGKALLALRALLHARSLDPGSGEVLYRTVDYSLRVPALLDEGGGLGDAARRIISEESICLLNDRSLEAFVGDAVELVRSSADPATLSLSYRVCVARAAVLSKLWSIKEACGLVTDGGLSDRGVNVESCREALVAMRSFGDEAQPAADEWIRQVQGRFPLLSDFS